MSATLTAESILPLFCKHPPFLPGGKQTDMVKLLHDSQKQAIYHMFCDDLNADTPDHKNTVNMFLYIIVHVQDDDLLTDFLYRVTLLHPVWNGRLKTVLQETLRAKCVTDFPKKKVLAYWHRAYGDHALDTLKSHYPNVDDVPLFLLWGMDQSHQLWAFIKDWDDGLHKKFWSRLGNSRMGKEEY